MEGAGHSALAILLRILLALFDLVGNDARLFACALPDIALVPSVLHLSFELVAAAAQLSDGLLREKLLESPFLNILLLVLLQLRDELDGTLKNGTLVLFATRNNLGELIDTLVDGLTTATLH